MRLSSDVIEEIINALAAGKAALFCGACISRDSGLPLALELTDEIVRWTGRIDPHTIDALRKNAGERSFDELLEYAEARHRRELLELGLPFERFMQVLSDLIDPLRLLDVYRSGEPNRNHIAIARLAGAGRLRLICTTNFDTLIEQALEREGIQFRVCADNFDRIDWESSLPLVIKLHGNVDDATSIAATLDNVSKRQLDRGAANVIEHLLMRGTHHLVLFAGYSCSDRFDITPQIRALRHTTKRIVCVAHETDIAKPHIADGTLFDVAGSYTLHCDTAWLIGEVWAKVLTTDAPPVATVEGDWRRRVKECCDYALAQSGELAFLMLNGNLLFHASRFEQAWLYFDAVTARTGDPKALANVGTCLLSLGDHANAAECLERATSIFESMSLREELGMNLMTLGIAYTRMGEYDRAMGCHHRGIAIADEIGDTFSQCGHLCNIAMSLCARRQGKLAIPYGESALDLAARNGHKYAEGRARNELGHAYFLEYAHDEALVHFEAAREIAIQIRDREGEGNALGNIGNVYGRTGELAKCISVNEEALAIAQEIRDRVGIATRHFNIATAAVRMGDFERSKHEYQETLDVATGVVQEEHPLIAESRVMLRQLERL